MSQKLPEIGQCPICLSNLYKSIIYAISKCGHTFHQKFIHQWISSANNCPTCRRNAFESDIIKLFIQENNVEIVIPKKEEILPYIETKYDGCFRRIMKECKCEITQYETGDLQFKCLKDFDINVCSYENIGAIRIIFPDFFVVRIHQSKKLDIVLGKTDEACIVDRDGIRFEHYYQRMRNGRKEILTTTQRTFRSNEGIFEQDKNCIKFYFPKFTVKRSFKNDENGKITICVYTNDPKKSLKIKICSEHQSFFVEHFLGNKITRCTNSEFLCDHLHE
uniref:RING-type domain-containing protein n=1 Tax=Panagrolaimus sp. PS1159 TaxID=55785 RepID=A0AC35G4G4_9BILA